MSRIRIHKQKQRSEFEYLLYYNYSTGLCLTQLPRSWMASKWLRCQQWKFPVSPHNITMNRNAGWKGKMGQISCSHHYWEIKCSFQCNLLLVNSRDTDFSKLCRDITNLNNILSVQTHFHPNTEHVPKTLLYCMFILYSTIYEYCIFFRNITIQVICSYDIQSHVSIFVWRQVYWSPYSNFFRAKFVGIRNCPFQQQEKKNNNNISMTSVEYLSYI